ncbi:MAG: glutamate--cysteine ligase [Psychromonas sp.]|jgi:glutamate--cysteine ligase
MNHYFNNKRLESTDDCIEYFNSCIKNRNTKLIGFEHELIIQDELSSEPVNYSGNRGIEVILKNLVNFGYKPVYENGRLLQLEKGGIGVSLEPGGQIEFSSSPCVFTSEIEDLFFSFLSDLQFVTKKLNLSILHKGYRPNGIAKEIELIPSERYQTLFSHFQKNSPKTFEQKMTASTQVSMDYHSEVHAGKAIYLSMRCQAFLAALFANSNIVNGIKKNVSSYRLPIWRKIDPNRCGTPSFIEENDFFSNTFSYYTEWALDTQLLFITRNNITIPIENLTFRSFLNNGFNEHEPLLEDWNTHLGTMYPETRLRNTVEMRSVDSSNPVKALALAPFWKGLIYSNIALDRAISLIDELTSEPTEVLFDKASKFGVRATTSNRESFISVLLKLINISDFGLTEMGESDYERSTLNTLTDEASKLMEKSIFQSKKPSHILHV